MRGLLSCLMIAVFATLAEAKDECNPLDFVDALDVQQSPETELAFVLTANQAQYDRVQSSAGSRGNYGLISTSTSFQQAQDRARLIAQATRFNYQNYYANNYLAQHTTNLEYMKCLQQDVTTPGLRVWLNHREGDYLFFSAVWVGLGPLATTAELDSPPFIDGGTILSSQRCGLKEQLKKL
jgi:hypothetical protein